MSPSNFDFDDAALGDDFLASSLQFLDGDVNRMDAASVSGSSEGGESPVPNGWDTLIPDIPGFNIKVEGNVVPSSPTQSRPGTPPTPLTDPKAFLHVNLATSNLTEEEKEKIRREKKREADRKCRKRKKERVSEMENKMQKLENEKKQLLARVEQLSRKSSPSSHFPSSTNPSDLSLARDAVLLFNRNIVDCANFIRSSHSPSCVAISPDSEECGRDAVLKFWIAMKQRFPGCALAVTDCQPDGPGKVDVRYSVEGLIDGSKPIAASGHFFLTVRDGAIEKMVAMWNSQAMLSTTDAGLAGFEDFWL